MRTASYTDYLLGAERKILLHICEYMQAAGFLDTASTSRTPAVCIQDSGHGTHTCVQTGPESGVDLCKHKGGICSPTCFSGKGKVSGPRGLVLYILIQGLTEVTVPRVFITDVTTSMCENHTLFSQAATPGHSLLYYKLVYWHLPSTI